MKRNEIKKLIKEAFTDNVYGKYPYSHQSGEHDEPKPDFVEEWKKFELSVVQDKTRQVAVDLAKIFVKDLELFNDVLDLVGQNQSLASEIMRKMEESEKEINNVV
tara:strand:+ start:289 stop:603 length:315 start_codon:yes stop_codon:yes gene_type:complete